MLLLQDPATGFWTEAVEHWEGRYTSFKLHTHGPDVCTGRGCAIHNHPSHHRLARAPLYWREDGGKLERVCEHGVGHDDYDSVQYLLSVDPSFISGHGCDGCCGGVI